MAVAKQISTPNINPYANIKLDIGGGINMDQNQGLCINNGLVFSTKGNANMFIGQNAGANTIGSLSTGAGNTFIGGSSGTNNTTGQFNLFCGNNSGFNNTTGSNNVYLGPAVATMSQTGSNNTYVGWASGNQSRGNNNTFLGRRSGNTNNSGSLNTYVGYDAMATGASAATLTNSAAIGANATVTANNCMVLGGIDGVNGAVESVNVGVGTTAPRRRFESLDNRNPQVRLTHTANTIFTDLWTLQTGDLLINPSNNGIARRVGINLTESNGPTRTLDVNGDARIRIFNDGEDKGIVTHSSDGTLHTLAFTGNTNEVLLGNGTFGVIPGGGTVSAVNGTWINTDGKVELGTNPLLHETEVPLNNKYLNFSGQSENTLYNSIGIGLSGETPPKAKLHVYQSSENEISYDGVIALQVNNQNSLSGNSTTNIGISSSSEGITISGKTINIGGEFFATNAKGNYGIKTISTNGGAAIWAIGNNSFAARFDGNIHVSGVPTTTNTSWVASDLRFKENIQNVQNATQKLSLLTPHTYTYKTSEYPQFNFLTGTHYGFIADEVKTLIPEIVMDHTSDATYDENGNEITPEITYNTMNYTGLIPIAVQSIKEIDTRVTELENSTGSTNSGWTGAGTGQMYVTNLNDKISIGTTSSFGSKLNVSNYNDQFCATFLTDASNISENYIPAGMRCQVSNAKSVNIGLEGISYSNQPFAQNYGLRGEAAGTCSQNTGLIGNAYGQSNLNIGISAAASGGISNWALHAIVPSSATNGLAGFFQGNVSISGNLNAYNFPGSDIMIKENIQNLNNGLGIISQLNPKSFNFKTSDFPQMRLPEGNQFGMIAQEVEQVLPDLVVEAYQPAEIDSMGNVLHQAFNYKALNYDAFIPVLIQAVKEQQDSINTLKNVIASYEARFNNIEALLASCCSSTNGNHGDGNNGNGNGNAKSTDINSVVNITPDNTFGKNETELYQNIPNPFTTKTTFNYTIGNKGNVELEIMTYSGQFVAKLVNSYQEEGNYSIDWNTSDIAPGIYFYTLRVNNVEWVKKAIRIK